MIQSPVGTAPEDDGTFSDVLNGMVVWILEPTPISTAMLAC